MKVAVLGVGTEVGKTWVAVRVLAALRSAGVAVAARKPVQSYGDGELGRTDAELLAAASCEPAGDVCPPHRWYPVPMAPPMAADHLGLAPFTVSDLVDEMMWPAATTTVLVETAGGVRSPIADDGDCATLVRRLAPDRTILVADAGLGTINAVRLALDSLVGLDPLVFLNRFDAGAELHRRNRAWLVDRDATPVVTDIDALVSGICDPPGR